MERFLTIQMEICGDGSDFNAPSLLWEMFDLNKV